MFSDSNEFVEEAIEEMDADETESEAADGTDAIELTRPSGPARSESWFERAFTGGADEEGATAGNAEVDLFCRVDEEDHPQATTSSLPPAPPTPGADAGHQLTAFSKGSTSGPEACI